MEYVDQIKKGSPADNGSVSNPDKIVKMQVAADAQKGAGKTVAERRWQMARSPAYEGERRARS